MQADYIQQNQSGTVKWYTRLKGFGFIMPDDGSSEVFVHYSEIVGDKAFDLYEGEHVVYDVRDNGKGPQAKNVRAVWPFS